MKILLGVVIAALVAAFFILDLGQYLNLAFAKEQQETLERYYHDYPYRTIFTYSTIYILATALSVPGAAILTLIAGAVFGLFTGTIVVSFCSTIGATLAFLIARFLLRDYVTAKFGARLKAIDKGLEQDGVFYLFTMRLIPAIPFFAINLLMGLTPIRTVPFFLVSQVGMLPGTVVYVNAGTQLAQLESLRGILSPPLWISFLLLGFFPLIAKKTIQFVNKRRHATT